MVLPQFGPATGSAEWGRISASVRACVPERAVTRSRDACVRACPCLPAQVTAQYGPGPTGAMYLSPSACMVVGNTHTQMVCQSAVGFGANMPWFVTVAGLASAASTGRMRCVVALFRRRRRRSRLRASCLLVAAGLTLVGCRRAATRCLRFPRLVAGPCQLRAY